MGHASHGRSISFAYLGVALPALAALLLYPYLISNLGAERFGMLSLVLSIAIFFGSFDFGVGLAITRYVARFDSRIGARNGIRRLVRHAIWLQIGIGLLTGTLLLAIHKIWGLVQATSASGLHAEVDRALVWLSLSIPLALMAGVLRCAIEGVGRFGVANALRAPASIGIFAVPIAISFITPRIDVLTLSLLLTRMATTLLFLVVWSRIAPPGLTRPSRPASFRRQAKVLLSYGGWVMVGVAAGGLIALGVLDRVLIARLVDVAEVVLYAVSSDVIMRGLLIPSAIASVLLPVLTRTVASSAAQVPDIHRKAMRIVASQAGPIAMLLVLHAESLLGALTRQPVTTEASQILRGMATGYFIHALAHVPYCGLHAASAPRAAGLRHLIQLPFYAAASSALLLAGHLGVMGWLWCLWALVDLLMLFVLLHRIAPRQYGLSALGEPQIWIWAALLGLSHVLHAQSVGGAPRLALSVLAGALFVWQLARVWTSRSLLDSSKT
jgi:O-antigen/teichoic acid export membrane protein